MKNERGFTLLEIMVALAILGTGFLLVVQLFSGGARLASASDEFLKGVSLANHKFAELEIENFETEATAGVFEQEPGFRWEMEVEPFASPLNNPEAGIQLSQVILKVLWGDGPREKQVQLASLFAQGTTQPAPDVVLLGNVSGLGVSATATSASGATGAQSITGTGNPSSPTGPGLVQAPPGNSNPATDPNFQFDISGMPVGKPPSNQKPLVGVTGGG